MGVESAYMNEAYRPFTKQEKRAHELRHKPWMYDYKVPLPAEMVIWERPREPEGSAVGMIVLALLDALIDLPADMDSGRESGGKTETLRNENGKI